MVLPGRDIPWKEFWVSLWSEILKDNLLDYASSVAFSAFLAIFPFLLFGVKPERTLMIGDTTHDLQMALNAGCPSVAVSYGAHEPAAFGDLQPLFIAHSVRELRDWLVAHA